MDLICWKKFFHCRRLLSLPSKHSLLLLPLLSSEPGGFRSSKKPKRTKAHRMQQWLFPTALNRSQSFGPSMKRISGNRGPLALQPSPQIISCLKQFLKVIFWQQFVLLGRVHWNYHYPGNVQYYAKAE